MMWGSGSSKCEFFRFLRAQRFLQVFLAAL